MANLTNLCIDTSCSDVQNLTPGDGIAISQNQVISAARNPANTYTKDEVNTLIGSLQSVSMEFVTQLPATGEDNVIYFVPNSGAAPNIYDEYVWVNGEWETIGDTQIDMNDYMRKDAMLDFVWPVGSYYETSETSFDPNVTWGGTWVLENEGSVHVGAGNTYANGSTGGSVTKSYTPQGSNAAVTLTAAQSGIRAHNHPMPHTHEFVHSHYSSGTSTPVNQWFMCTTETVTQTHQIATGSSGKYAPTFNSASKYSRRESASGVNMPDTTTDGPSNANTSNNTAGNATASHNHTFTGTASDINVMQPYVAVNRWHRTA